MIKKLDKDDIKYINIMLSEKVTLTEIALGYGYYDSSALKKAIDKLGFETQLVLVERVKG